MKRGLLYACCREQGYNKLVLAQHLDDLAESFIMSALHNGQVCGCIVYLRGGVCQPPLVFYPHGLVNIGFIDVWTSYLGGDTYGGSEGEGQRKRLSSVCLCLRVVSVYPPGCLSCLRPPCLPPSTPLSACIVCCCCGACSSSLTTPRHNTRKPPNIFLTAVCTYTSERIHLRTKTTEQKTNLTPAPPTPAPASEKQIAFFL